MLLQTSNKISAVFAALEQTTIIKASASEAL